MLFMLTIHHPRHNTARSTPAVRRRINPRAPNPLIEFGLLINIFFQSRPPLSRTSGNGSGSFRLVPGHRMRIFKTRFQKRRLLFGAASV